MAYPRVVQLPNQRANSYSRLPITRRPKANLGILGTCAARSYTPDVEPNNVETLTGKPKELAIKRQQNERCHKRRISCITDTSHHLRGPLARCTQQYVRYESNSCSELMTSFRVFTIIRPDVTPDGFRGCVQAIGCNGIGYKHRFMTFSTLIFFIETAAV